jgi:hypothetical protein
MYFREEKIYLSKYPSIYLSPPTISLNLYAPPSIIRMIKSRRMRFAAHVSRMGEETNAYRTLVGKPERKRPLGRPRRRWIDNIKMDLREIGWDGVDWMDGYGSEWGPVEGSCEHGIESSGSIKCWEVLEVLHNWRLLKKGSAP